MIRIRSHRSRIALSFAAAVLCAGLLYAVASIAILVVHERDEAHHFALGVYASEEEENWDLILKLAVAAAVIAPVAAAGAGAVGLWLARKALAPLGDAAQRAKAARTGAQELLLPIRGADDEWDRLAVVLNELLEDERRSMARARSFSANAAHELRTPLTAILGEVQVALRRERSAEEYREALRGVEGEVSRLSTLVERLLTLARADSGELRAHAVTFDLATVASEAVAAARARHPGASGLIRVEGDAVPARGDPVLSRRVLDNLIENAVLHGAGSVEVRVARDGALGVASVSDDGPGLPKRVRARLFERFNREMNAAGGFGLGLAIAQALTTAQGGRLRLDEEPGPTRFVFEVPAAVGEVDAAR